MRTSDRDGPAGVCLYPERPAASAGLEAGGSHDVPRDARQASASNPAAGPPGACGDLATGRTRANPANGRLVRSVREFLDLHRGWFESKSWTLATRPVSLTETADLG